MYGNMLKVGSVRQASSCDLPEWGASYGSGISRAADGPVGLLHGHTDWCLASWLSVRVRV